MVPPNEYIFHIKEDGDRCYLLRSGQVEILVKNKDYPELKRLTVLTAPAIFGEAALITSAKRNASVRTLEQCELLAIGKNTQIKVLGDNPAVARLILSVTTQREQGGDEFFHFTNNGWVAF